MRVLMTVSNSSLRNPWSLRVLDQSSLSAHMCAARGIFFLAGVSSTQQELGARCVAEVLLQYTRRLVEVRARYGARLVWCHRAC